MIDKKQAARLKRAVNRLIKAAVNNSWKGGGDPMMIPYIEAEYKNAERAYRKVLREITGAVVERGYVPKDRTYLR